MGWFFSGSHPYAVGGSARNRADGTFHRGRLLVDGDALVFEAETARVEFPLQGLKADRNRLWGGPIRLWHRAVPDWMLATRHTTLFSDPAFEQSEALLHARQRLHLRRYNARRLVKLLLLLALVSYIAFPSFRSAVTAQALRFVSTATEIEMGERAFREVARAVPMLDDAEAQAALAQIARRITAALPPEQRQYPLRFHIARDPNVNAFALPGGHIVVHSRLIVEAESAEELAGVLAHEIGHVVHRHSFRQMTQNFGTMALLGALVGDLDYVPDTAMEWVAQSYSRDDESEADRTALALLEASRTDPQGLVRFFDRLAREYKRHVGGQMDLWMRMNSSHPLPAERAAALRDGAARFSPGFSPEPIPVDYRALRRRLADLTLEQ